MPNLHLTKVALGCANLDSLRARLARRASGGELRVATRRRPRRADELVRGNLYWIVKHRILAASTILRFEDRDDGRIDIVARRAWRRLPRSRGGRIRAGAIWKRIRPAPTRNSRPESPSCRPGSMAR